jgi:hypothetical protein
MGGPPSWLQPPAKAEGVTRFVDDDYGYRQWLQSHPNGYVLNCGRSLTLASLMLHKASCDAINMNVGSIWLTSQGKVCATSTLELDGWAYQTTGGVPTRCETCQP